MVVVQHFAELQIVLLVAQIVLLDLKIVLHCGLHEIVQADYFHSIH